MSISIGPARDEIAAQRERARALEVLDEAVERVQGGVAIATRRAEDARTTGVRETYHDARVDLANMHSLLWAAKLDRSRYKAVEAATDYAKAVLDHLKEKAPGIIAELCPHLEVSSGISVLPSWKPHWDCDLSKVVSDGSFLVQVSEGGKERTFTFVVEQKTGLHAEEMQLRIYDGLVDDGTYNHGSSHRYDPAKEDGYKHCHLVTILSYSSQDWDEALPAGVRPWDQNAARSVNAWNDLTARSEQRLKALRTEAGRMQLPVLAEMARLLSPQLGEHKFMRQQSCGLLRRAIRTAVTGIRAWTARGREWRRNANG